MPVYTEPLAKTTPLVGVISPSAYSNSTYATTPVEFGQFGQLLATILTGLNLPSSSVIVGALQYSSASNAGWTTLDDVQGTIQFGIGSPTLPGTQKSLELRGEALGSLPVGAARYWRLSVTTSSSSSGDVAEFCATLVGANWRWAAKNFFGPAGQSGMLSSSLSNGIYSVALPWCAPWRANHRGADSGPMTPLPAARSRRPRSKKSGVNRSTTPAIRNNYDRGETLFLEEQCGPITAVDDVGKRCLVVWPS